jgi:hypothetical protein
MHTEPRKHAAQHTAPRVVLEEASELKFGHERGICTSDRKRRLAASMAKADVCPSAPEDHWLSPLERGTRSA